MECSSCLEVFEPSNKYICSNGHEALCNLCDNKWITTYKATCPICRGKYLQLPITINKYDIFIRSSPGRSFHGGLRPGTMERDFL